MSKIEFIIPTYDRTDHLMCILNSLCSQTSDRWIAHVVADCPPENSLDKIMNYFDGDERIKFTILPVRHNDWGHTPRNYGLEHATEEWVVMTGEDNYYVPTFVKTFLDVATPSTHFIFCDMVHNWVNNQYIHLKSNIAFGQIDIGNFASKRKYASQLKLNTSINQADWLFIENYLTKFPEGKIKYIPKTLYVHN